VLALLSGEFTIKRYRKKGARIWLQAENLAFGDILLNDETVFEVWGVITKSIRML
jgi:DNA polymerase V